MRKFFCRLNVLWFIYNAPLWINQKNSELLKPSDEQKTFVYGAFTYDVRFLGREGQAKSDFTKYSIVPKQFPLHNSSILHVYWYLSCTFINFEKKFPPALPYFGLHV